jgi:hypothetical protein
LQYLAPIIYFIAFAFAASILVLIPKALFFLKRRFAYEYILKHSIIAIIVGIAAAYGIYFYFYPRFIDVEGEQLLAIPFYCMLAGTAIGSLRLYLKDKLIKNKV